MDKVDICTIVLPMDYQCINIESGKWPKITPDLLAPRVIVGSYWILPQAYNVNYFNSGIHLILITHGELFYQGEGGEKKTAGGREMIAVFPGKDHHYGVKGNSPVSMYQVSFFATSSPAHQGVPFLPGYGFFPEQVEVGEKLGEFISLFEQIIHVLMNLPVTWQSVASARLLDLINLTFNQVTSETDNNIAHMNQWDRVIAQLENHQDPPSIQELAESINMSPEQFIRNFRKHIGHTPKHYFQERRLWKARQLLTSGRMVKEVALECGFRDQLYFSRLFRKHFGIAPSKFTMDSNLPPVSIDPVLPISRNFFAPGVHIQNL